MPIIAYREQRFNRKSEVVVKQAISIIEDLKAQGYVLTLRQLYYQFVSRNWLENTEQSYKRLGSIVSDAREVGRIDWNDIEDRGRAAILQGHTPSPEQVLKKIELALRLDPWLDQEVYVETYVEKSALEGVVSRPCDRWRAPYMACKGYLSTSEAWRAGRRFERAIERGKRPVLIHLGDHDPSGLQMTEDNGTRLAMFARQGVEVRRIALNMDQVEQYELPENPAKTTDSRATGYIAKHGPHSWELDALLPKVIDDLIDAQLQSLIDKDAWERTLAKEKEEREPLRLLGIRWDEVRKLVLCDEVDPMERLHAMDKVLEEVPYHLEQAKYRWPESADRLAANTKALVCDRLDTLQLPEAFPCPPDVAPGVAGPIFKTGFDRALELADEATDAQAPLRIAEDSQAMAQIAGLGRMAEHIKSTLIKVPYERPAAEPEASNDDYDEEDDLYDVEDPLDPTERD